MFYFKVNSLSPGKYIILQKKKIQIRCVVTQTELKSENREAYCSWSACLIIILFCLAPEPMEM